MWERVAAGNYSEVEGEGHRISGRRNGYEIMHERRDVEALIKAHGGVLKRQRKHQVWSFPNGRTLTLSVSPSDFRAVEGMLADLRKLVGIERESRKNPQRKRKPGVTHKLDIEPSGVRVRELRSQLTRIRNQLPSN